jgi:hypothetical protein
MTAPTLSALSSALLLTAGLCAFAPPAAAADPPPQTVQMTPASQGLGPDSPADHQAPATASRRTDERSFPKPEYANDPKSEADCYYVFGQLRCDRVPRREPRPGPR